MEDLAESLGAPRYRGRQLAGWIFTKGVADFEAMSDLPRDFRVALADSMRVELPEIERRTPSQDGSQKLVLRYGDGARVQAVLMPDGDRLTLCVSTQVGCGFGCAFCFTGTMGLERNLSAGEIVAQVMVARRGLPAGERITHIVYMGMGEPLDNLDNVLESLEVLCADYGFGMSPTRITVSTVGLVPAMRRFLDRSRCHLAISLHTPFEEERRHLMPVENVYPLKEVLAELRARAIRGQRRVSFEYILFDRLNDTPQHARELARVLSGIRCRVNLIAFHPIPGTPLEPSPRATMEQFEAQLREHGILATIRRSRGQDIAAACGMLSTRELMRRKRDAEQ